LKFGALIEGPPRLKREIRNPKNFGKSSQFIPVFCKCLTLKIHVPNVVV
jgi:hypothetical protein